MVAVAVAAVLQHLQLQVELVVIVFMVVQVDMVQQALITLVAELLQLVVAEVQN
jgi:hypothetical protein